MVIGHAMNSRVNFTKILKAAFTHLKCKYRKAAIITFVQISLMKLTPACTKFDIRVSISPTYEKLFYTKVTEAAFFTNILHRFGLLVTRKWEENLLLKCYQP
jgi:hypothetical protein